MSVPDGCLLQIDQVCRPGQYSDLEDYESAQCQESYLTGNDQFTIDCGPLVAEELADVCTFFGGCPAMEVFWYIDCPEPEASTSAEPTECVEQKYYQDADCDGHGDPNSALWACGIDEAKDLSGSGCVTTSVWVADCDDNDEASNPVVMAKDCDCDGYRDEYGEDWTCAGDMEYAFCDGGVPTPACWVPLNAPVDCDDSDAAKVPQTAQCLENPDGDNFGDGEFVAYNLCKVAEPGLCLSEVTDCFPSDPLAGPNVALCQVDEDGDGWGVPEWVELPCGESCPAVLPGDCDDTEAAVHPLGEEVCDGLDNNCSGAIDDLPPVCFDGDGDGHGNGLLMGDACASHVDNYVDNCWDCDDTDDTVYNTLLLYPDLDDDNVGTGFRPDGVCVAECDTADCDLEGWAASSGDCDDTNPNVTDCHDDSWLRPALDGLLDLMFGFGASHDAISVDAPALDGLPVDGGTEPTLPAPHVRPDASR